MSSDFLNADKIVNSPAKTPPGSHRIFVPGAVSSSGVTFEPIDPDDRSTYRFNQREPSELRADSLFYIYMQI